MMGPTSIVFSTFGIRKSNCRLTHRTIRARDAGPERANAPRDTRDDERSIYKHRCVSIRSRGSAALPGNSQGRLGRTEDLRMTKRRRRKPLPQQKSIETFAAPSRFLREQRCWRKLHPGLVGPPVRHDGIVGELLRQLPTVTRPRKGQRVRSDGARPVPSTSLVFD